MSQQAVSERRISQQLQVPRTSWWRGLANTLSGRLGCVEGWSLTSPLSCRDWVLPGQACTSARDSVKVLTSLCHWAPRLNLFVISFPYFSQKGHIHSASGRFLPERNYATILYISTLPHTQYLMRFDEYWQVEFEMCVILHRLSYFRNGWS